MCYIWFSEELAYSTAPVAVQHHCQLMLLRLSLTSLIGGKLHWADSRVKKGIIDLLISVLRAYQHVADIDESRLGHGWNECCYRLPTQKLKWKCSLQHGGRIISIKCAFFQAHKLEFIIASCISKVSKWPQMSTFQHDN